MSAAASKAELFQTIDDCAHVLSDACDRLLRRILRFDSGGSGCWASIETLAAELAWSRTKVKETLRQLHANGHIWTVHDRGGSRAIRHINWPTLNQHRRTSPQIDWAESRPVEQVDRAEFPVDRSEKATLTGRNPEP